PTEWKPAAAGVFGLSTHTPAAQQELVARLHSPFPILTDEAVVLTRAMRLPTFRAAGHTLLRRLTFVIRDRRVEHVWYPVFPPDLHAERVLEWLRNPTGWRANTGVARLPRPRADQHTVAVA